MCGINGFNFEDKSLIKLMNKTIIYRGPDDNGFQIRKNLSLGHTRLSIQDLSKSGQQPFKFKNLEIIFNGEIYNFLELKKELKNLGYKFKSKTDTEVILFSYLQWGKKCVEKFNGMWAFVIYDKINQELFLSRDRFGEKPLYYYLKNKKFIFSSEIKSILKSKIKKEINKKYLNEFFKFRFSIDDKTILKNIFNFKAGHNMIFDLKNNEIKSYKKYYDLSEIILKKSKLNYSQSKKNLFNLIEQSVKKRMISDVPVACFLSGGIDSSIITYFAKKYNKNLNTFSVGFDTTNELSYAKIVSNDIGTKHHEIIINKDNVLDYLEKMVYHMDEPIGADPGFLPIFVLSKFVSKKFKVVLSGDGADEIFTGYDRYKLFYYGKYLKNFTVFNFNNEIYKKLKLMKNKNSYNSFIEIIRVFDESELKKLEIKDENNKEIFNSIKNKNSLNKIQIFDIKTLLLKDFFMKSDKMSSAFGLEQRIPFMDKKIVEFGLKLPIRYRLFFWNEKRILKDISKKFLPKEIYKRRKQGFNVPITYWFENVLAEKLLKLLKTRKHNLYNCEYIYILLENLKNNKTGFKSKNIIAQKLWTILIFEMWHERFMK